MANDKFQKAIKRLNNLIAEYAPSVTEQGMYSAFTRAAMGVVNQPQIQNRRIKSISSLPVDYTKEDIGEFTRNPYQSEKQLRETSEILRWTNYPYFKLTKTAQDIPTYRYYAKPIFATNIGNNTSEYTREATLIDKFNYFLRPDLVAHEIAGKAISQGKVAYIPRFSIDKSHNKVNYAFLQQLPEDWTTIIGHNNISGYTVSFNMMYFLQPGTTVATFGEGEDNLFAPFLDDFEAMFVPPKNKNRKMPESHYCSVSVKSNNKKIDFYIENANPNAVGNPKVFMQNGSWAYYVSLPIDKVWVFSIDDTSPAIASPFSGLFLTYSQQADYEAAQLSLLLNPLIKIFTGEVETYGDNTNMEKDMMKITAGLQAYYSVMFNDLMTANNTGGTAFYTAPYKNIKSHDYGESANANEISSSFNKYAGSKAGMNALIPVTDDIKAGQVASSENIEARFVTSTIYPQFERMMNYIYGSFNLKYDFSFKMFGDIFHDDKHRENAMQRLDKGDISAYYELCALDGETYLERISKMQAIKASGMLELLEVPPTSYTQSNDNSAGRPKTDDISESKEKSIDMGYSQID